jgi:hypothetical protein
MTMTVSQLSRDALLPTVGVPQTYRNDRGSGRCLTLLQGKEAETLEGYPVTTAFDAWVAKGLSMQVGALMSAVSSYRGNGEYLPAAKAAVGAVRRRFALACRGMDINPGMTDAERRLMALGFAEWNLARTEAQEF